MAYQVLARKWRPQDFDSVVGQKPIVTALGNALEDGRIAQAYLFSGIRGVGKTSVARILAKALNCAQGPTSKPCNECESCQEITSGQGFDVLEFDAATYSKVDQIRELTESLKYGPAGSRYKVVILDEIHRLSRQAFDALLKIVEEPPAHLVFVFATTEPEAVPVTILSRCQEFRFRRVPIDDLVQHLEKICAAEKIQTGAAALRLIARAGDGSVRDAVALLDQLATFGSGTIDDQAAAGLLGGLGNDVLYGLLESVVTGAADRVSDLVREVDSQGWDPRHVYGEFLSYCRAALHLALDGDPARLDLPAEEAATLAELAKSAGYENLLRLLHLLLESEMTVRRSESGSLAVEIAWLRAAELPKLTRLEDLLRGGGPEPSSNARRGKAAEPGPPAPATSSKSTARAASVELAAAPEPPPAQPQATESPGSAEPRTKPPGKPSTDVLLEILSRRKQSLAAHLAEARSLVFDSGVLKILAPAGDTWLCEALERESNKKVLTEALEELCGPGATWKLEECPEEPKEPEKSRRKPNKTESRGKQTAEPEQAAQDQDPRVQAVLDIFGGSVESVEEHRPSGES